MGNKPNGIFADGTVLGDNANNIGAVDSFSGPQVCKIVNISYRQLDYWATTGLLTPSIKDANGSGSRRLYSYEDLLELKVIKRLLDAGISLGSCRKAIRCLRDNLGNSLRSASLVLTGTNSVMAKNGNEITDLLKGGQGVFNIVPLAGVVQELEAAVYDLAKARQQIEKSADEDRPNLAVQPPNKTAAL
ncbi:MAG: MerR family transcriptional regulator [Actinobacteria bacterium]|nr:MerR family transcriptional regulator [Actinomycetota bacterium]MCL6104190.1 MerR family transcriptional regulator [Actinomycetota bacterium]